MTHAIVTGGAGFVGSHLVRHLLTNTDWTLALPVSFRHRGSPMRLVVATEDHPEWWDRLTVVRCDLSAGLDGRTLDALGGAEARLVFNVASESHVDRSISDPVPFVENNVSLALSVLEACRRMPRLEALLQVSTDEVYGPVPAGASSIEWDPIVPSNPYAASKAAQEALAVAYWRTYDVPLVITNTMNIIGETQDPEKFLPLLVRSVLRGDVVSIHAAPDGTPGSRHYLHARNQADALLTLASYALESPHVLSGRYGSYTEGLRREHDVDRPPRFNVAGDREVSNLDLAHLVATIVDRPLHAELVDFHSSRPGHDLRYALDGARMELLDWVAPVSFEESVERTVRWTLDHPVWIRS